MRGALAGLAVVWASALGAAEFTTLKGHGGPVMALAVSPEGRVASASFDNSVGVWRGRVPVWLEGHEAAVTSVAWGLDGMLASGGDDFAVRLWEVGHEVPPDQVRGRPSQVRDGVEIVADVGRELGRHRGKVAALAFAPSGDWLASGSWDGSVRLWSLDGDETRTLAAPGTAVNALACVGDEVLLAGTAAGEILRYDLSTGEALPLVRHGFGVNTLVVGDGWIAYGAVDGGTRIVDMEGREIADFTLDRRPILAMAWHAETQQLAVGDGQGFIMIVDTQDWQIARDFRATREGPVWALDFGPAGEMIYASGIDDLAYGWPVASLDAFAPGITGDRSFLRDAATMPNGERQFMRKCSICHALEAGPSRKAGPSLYGVFGRPAGSLPGYAYSDRLQGAPIVWGEDTIDALFDQGPDHYIPGSKMPMQVIAGAEDRADLIAFLKTATAKEPAE
ncbi:c-type cytochrome [Marinovum sp.]|uniref:c-type cytochrome n=1 Tax=Marinovum sp. TaxID=2024839 RepID=UPI002B270550|nr:c-type cytochrome [Marinovum sp.]